MCQTLLLALLRNWCVSIALVLSKQWTKSKYKVILNYWQKAVIVLSFLMCQTLRSFVEELNSTQLSTETLSLNNEQKKSNIKILRNYWQKLLYCQFLQVSIICTG
jgi:hypothetical protein